MLNDYNTMSVKAASVPYADMYSTTGYIKDDSPNALRIIDASKSARINLANGSVKERFLENYTAGKCTIADLIWWELEEVTE